MGLAEGRGQREFFTAHSADPAPLRSVLQVITVSAHLSSLISNSVSRLVEQPLPALSTLQGVCVCVC